MSNISVPLKLWYPTSAGDVQQYGSEIAIQNEKYDICYF